MVFAIARPVSRPNSSFAQFRKRVPAGNQRLAKGKQIVIKLPAGYPGGPDLVLSVKLGCEVSFSLRTRDPALVKLCHAAASAQLEPHFRALKAGLRWLNRKERVASPGLPIRTSRSASRAFPANPRFGGLSKRPTNGLWLRLSGPKLVRAQRKSACPSRRLVPEADLYRHADIGTMAEAIARLKVPSRSPSR